MKRVLVMTAAALCALAAVAPRPVIAQAADDWQLSDSWRFSAGINGYLPDVGLHTTLPNGASSDISIGISTILRSLNMAFAGEAEARKGRWGAFTDVLYMDLSSAASRTRNFTLGPGPLPADVRANITVDMKATIWTFAGSYRAVANPNLALDVFAGGRLFDVTVNQAWQLTGNVGPVPLPGGTDRSEASVSFWDAIVGTRGRLALDVDRKWFVPYYLDVGTGGAKLTWQMLGGVGYAFNWGDVTVTWRYLDYTNAADQRIENVNMSGPQVACAFRW